MRITKLLGLAVVLVAMAVAINALAFKTADVTNNMALKIVGTETAALAMLPGTGDGAGSVVGADGILKIALAKFPQPGSTYVFDDVFRVKNNAAASRTITLPASVLLGTTTQVTVSFVNSAGTPVTSVVVGAGATENIGLKIITPDTFTSNNTLDTNLTATVLINAQ